MEHVQSTNKAHLSTTHEKCVCMQTGLEFHGHRTASDFSNFPKKFAACYTHTHTGNQAYARCTSSSMLILKIHSDYVVLAGRCCPDSSQCIRCVREASKKSSIPGTCVTCGEHRSASLMAGVHSGPNGSCGSGDVMGAPLIWH